MTVTVTVCEQRMMARSQCQTATDNVWRDSVTGQVGKHVAQVL